jgi:hypothetical protein
LIRDHYTPRDIKNGNERLVTVALPTVGIIVLTVLISILKYEYSALPAFLPALFIIPAIGVEGDCICTG